LQYAVPWLPRLPGLQDVVMAATTLLVPQVLLVYLVVRGRKMDHSSGASTALPI
jgi:hypothetical protein